jgi:hypothetical protein
MDGRHCERFSAKQSHLAVEEIASSLESAPRNEDRKPKWNSLYFRTSGRYTFWHGTPAVKLREVASLHKPPALRALTEK